MKNLNLLQLFVAGFLALTAFSCSSDSTEEVTPPPTKEELQEQERVALATTSDSIFKAVVEGDWKLVEFVASEQLIEASKGDQIGPNTYANTKLKKVTAAKPLDMTLTFTKEGDKYDVSVSLPTKDDQELEKLLMSYQNSLYPDFADWGVLVLPKEELMADAKTVLAGPFSSDKAETDEVSDAKTGKIIFQIEQNDVSNLSYEDILLKYTQVLNGNTDRVFFNEKGQLIVEDTDNTYGTSTSHYVFEKVAQ